MFISELSPLFQELREHPVSFLSGFVSGLLRINLTEDPVKTWLEKQSSSCHSCQSTTDDQNGASSKPQQISID
jgi:hypothetical protein